MGRILLLFLVIALPLTGCLRSTVVVKRANAGRLAVEHTLLFKREEAIQLVNTGVSRETIDSLLNGTVNVSSFVAQSRYALDPHYTIKSLENVTTPSDAGFRIIAEIERPEYFTPTMGELLYFSLPTDTTVVSFKDSNNTLHATVHPRALVKGFASPAGEEPKESDIRQFALAFSFVKELTLDLILDQGGSSDTLIQVNARTLTEILNTDDSVARSFLTITAGPDQDVIDFLASFPPNALRVPQLTRQAVAPRIFTVKVPDPPTQSEIAAALLDRLTHNTRSMVFLSDVPSVLALRMSAIQQDSYKPLPWNGTLDTLITMLRTANVEMTVDSTARGRTLSVDHVEKRWPCRYELTERSGHGLVDAVEISWPGENASGVLEYAREHVPLSLKVAGLQGEVVLDTPTEYRVRYRDQHGLPMEQYLTIEKGASHDTSTNPTLRVGRRVVQ